MQQSPTADRHERRFRNSHCPRQPNGHRRYTLGVAFRFLVAEVERPDPALKRGLVRRRQVGVCLLKTHSRFCQGFSEEFRVFPPELATRNRLLPGPDDIQHRVYRPHDRARRGRFR